MVNELIENNIEIEEILSDLEHKKLLEFGLATLPHEEEITQQQ